MKRLYLLMVVGLIFITGCIPQSNDVLDINLYDADGKLLANTNIMAVVNNVPNVEFIDVSIGIRNDGNVELNPKVDIEAPPSILNAIQGYISKQGNQATCEPCISRQGCIHCVLLVGLLENDMWGLHTHQFPISEIGVGNHIIKVEVDAQYEDDGIKHIRTSAMKTIKIEKDPVKAAISVDIGTGSSQPPPPCKIRCDNNRVLRGDCCISQDILPPQECIKPIKVCIISPLCGVGELC